MRFELKPTDSAVSGRNVSEFGTVRPRVQIPGPRPKIVFKSRSSPAPSSARVTGRSQIFLELGGGSPVLVDFEPSIELAHGSRTADISPRARSPDREAPGFENQRRCSRRWLPTHRSGS